LRVPLHEVENALIADAQVIPERHDAGGLERIVSLKDRVWFKSRVSRWRAASTKLALSEIEEDLRPGRQGHWWVGAAGWRESGSGDDFYEALKAEAGADSDGLLPNEWDWKRLTGELGVAWERTLTRTVLELVATSLRTGHVVEAEARHHRISALVRAENGADAYLAIGAEGIPDPRVIALILDAVPGVPRGDWQAEPGHVSGIKPKTGQIVFSTMFAPEACAEVLAISDESDIQR
jgi:hypothetical protein